MCEIKQCVTLYGILKKRNKPSAEKLSNMLNALILNLDETDTFFNGRPDFLSQSETSRWVQIENDQEIQEALIGDEIERIVDMECDTLQEVTSSDDIEMREADPVPPPHLFLLI